MRVAVIGGGVMGAATAWRLAKRGADVVVYDRHSPPHALGSSHGESRIIRTAYFEGSWYVPLLQEVFGLWRELEGISGKRLLTMTGALMIGGESSENVAGALAAAKEHHLDAEFLDTEALRRRYRGHVVRAGDVAALDRQAGLLQPAPPASVSRTSPASCTASPHSTARPSRLVGTTRARPQRRRQSAAASMSGTWIRCAC